MKKYIFELRHVIALQILFALISISGIASMPYIVKELFDYDFSKGLSGVTAIVLMYILAITVGMFFEYLLQRTIWKFRQRFYCLLKQDLFDTLLRKTYVDFKQYDVSDYLTFFGNDIDVFRQYLESVISIIQTILQLVVYTFFLFKLDYRLAIVIILCSLASLVIPKVTGGQLADRKKKHLEAMASYTDTIRDLLSGFRFVNGETRNRISMRHKTNVEFVENKGFQFGKYKSLTNVITGSSMYFLQSIVFMVIGVLLFRKQITVGSASAALGYIQDFCYPVSYILKDINTINASRAGKERILEVLKKESGLKETKYIETFKNAIRFENVSVQLGEYCFSSFSYTFEKGKKYAIIGPSGSGKSTILNMLMQYIYPDQGAIYIDGENTKGKDTSNIMICINQFEHIFHASFEENVTVFGTYREEKVQETLRMFENSKVDSLVKKINAQTLSGGEHQMMQLVRLVTADKPIILLDESFSSIDVNSAQQLQRKLFELDKTVLFVTHDVSAELLSCFDEVIELRRKEL